VAYHGSDQHLGNDINDINKIEVFTVKDVVIWTSSIGHLWSNN
jgi:hypothetical protein